MPDVWPGAWMSELASSSGTSADKNFILALSPGRPIRRPGQAWIQLNPSGTFGRHDSRAGKLQYPLSSFLALSTGNCGDAFELCYFSARFSGWFTQRMHNQNALVRTFAALLTFAIGGPSGVVAAPLDRAAVRAQLQDF